MGRLQILSRSGEAFRDRDEAGQLLGNALKFLAGKNAVVVGIPRGGMVVASALAQAVEADLDLILSRKLGAPGNEELAIGAVGEHGDLYVDKDMVDRLGVDSIYLEKVKQRQLEEIARRRTLYRKVLPKLPLKGRVVCLTDDGIATGATFQAALWAIRQEQPKKLLAAIPVGPEETVERLAKDADQMLCLKSPPYFDGVGRFYRHFDQVDDEDLLDILRMEQTRRKRP
jgi:predicted phosphoribosyltransferase